MTSTLKVHGSRFTLFLFFFVFFVPFVPCFAAEDTSSASPHLATPHSLFDVFIPFLAPILIAAVKFFVPQISKPLLPWLAPLFGAAIAWIANAAGAATNPATGAILGAVGVAVREAYDQAKKGLKNGDGGEGSLLRERLALLVFFVCFVPFVVFSSACASQKTHVLETRDSSGLIARSIDVKTRTFFDSSSRLADYDATANDAGQGVKIGELSQESHASNVVRMLELANEAFQKSKGGTFAP